MLRFIDLEQKWEDLALNIELLYPGPSFLMTSRTVQTCLLSRENKNILNSISFAKASCSISNSSLDFEYLNILNILNVDF